MHGYMCLGSFSWLATMAIECHIPLYLAFILNQQQCTSKEGQIGMEFAYKLKTNFCNVDHFSLHYRLALKSDHHFHLSFQNCFQITYITFGFYLYKVETHIMLLCAFPRYNTYKIYSPTIIFINALITNQCDLLI